MPRLPLLCLTVITLLPAVLPFTPEPGLPAPTNVRIDSYNLKSIMKWDPVVVTGETLPVMYTVEIELYHGFHKLCANITETECDFTEKIRYYIRGKLQVRAELGSRRSDWVVLPAFQPSVNTTIGPVNSLVLHSSSDTLTVDFSPPFEPIPIEWMMNYQLSYWKENSEDKETVDLHSSTTHLLDALEPNVNYCVQVYAYTHYITGLPSAPVCKTTVKGIALYVVLFCVSVSVFIALVIMLLVIPDRPLHKALSSFKDWLSGPYRIPVHVMEYLEAPPFSAPVEYSPFSEQIDHISIVGLDLSQDAEETISDQGQESAEKT